MIAHATRISFLLMGSAWLLAGCASKVNPIETNISYGPDDRFATRMLDASERAEVITIMQDSVDGPTDDPARPAPYGVRWSDVRLAAVKAGGTMELAVLSLSEEEGGMVKRIELISIGDVPVELVVRRVPEPEIYEASAKAGLFDDRAELASRLVEAFDVAMRAYGSKPGWNPLPDG
ncbi:MAG: hypothetical protein MK082_02080 [Phycisphaerales bacterium]|nr:hypothetical protein [Phycisphaerales bacterium]